MLEKTYVKSRKVAKVKFVVPAEQLAEGGEVETVHLVGDFNDWDEQATPMTLRKKDGAYYVSLDLEPGKEYAFRYLVNGEHWCNDWNADRYAAGAFDTENSIVVTPAG